MTLKQKKGFTVFIHIACWVVFLSLPTLFNPRFKEITAMSFIEDFSVPFRWQNSLLLIGIYYFNYFIAIPKLYLKHNYLLFLLSLMVCFSLFCLVNYLNAAYNNLHPYSTSAMLQEPGFTAPRGAKQNFGFLGNSFNVFMFIIVYAASFSVCLYEQWRNIKQQMLLTQISFLKAQINPHFLFNTLNSIYSLTLMKSDKAPDVVVKLSDMMRYAVSEANQSYVTLSKELAYISNYIELQKLRLADKVKIRYEVSGQEYDKKIAPFLLIPFVENAFKYGVNSDQDSDILIQIYILENDLHLYAYNFKVYIRPDIDKGTGLGITTTRQRLNLLYPGKHILTVRDGVKDFAVSLNINF